MTTAFSVSVGITAEKKYCQMLFPVGTLVTWPEFSKKFVEIARSIEKEEKEKAKADKDKKEEFVLSNLCDEVICERV